MEAKNEQYTEIGLTGGFCDETTTKLCAVMASHV